MNKIRFSLYKIWFYFGVGQAPGHPHPCRGHCGKGKIECQTLVINITAINKSIKTRLWRYPGTRVLFKNRIKPDWIKPDTASPGKQTFLLHEEPASFFGNQVSNQLISILQSLKVQWKITLDEQSKYRKEKIGRCFMDYKAGTWC
jgi:hypothetical protein